MSTRQSSKYLIIAAICCGTLYTAQGQFVSNYKKAADTYYAKGDYNSAAQYYEKYIGYKAGAAEGYDPYLIQKQGATVKEITDRAGVIYNMAESYRNLTYYAKAEEAYQKVTELAPAQYPLARYWYGVSLRANGKYQLAEKQLTQFIAGYKTNDAYKKQALVELENCQFIQKELANQSQENTVNKLGSAINKEGANYAAAWAADTLVFTSTRGTYTNRLYTTVKTDSAAVLAIPGAGKDQQGVASFTADGSKVYFTAWETTAEGKKASAIYSSEKKAGVWGQPVLLNANVNTVGYNARQPQITADGKYLLFASDKPGGSGKFDIWYAPVDQKGNIGKAVNAGKLVNTPEDEEAPFYHQSSGSLVFASNGKTGMGGFDLYAAKGQIGGALEPAVNLGYPVNSVKDDIYFVNKQNNALLDNAMISSDRSSACCLELFAVKKAVVVAKTPVPEVKPEPVPDPTPAAPVAAVPVKEEPKTDVVMENNKLLPHVLFTFNSAIIDETQDEHLKAVAEYLKQHPEIKAEVGAYTDGKGTKAFNLQLSKERAASCIKYLLKQGVDKSRLIAKGYGDCCPLEAETTADGKDIPEAREKNRRVELKVL
jgi:outer membrane protein OmpA-like peptidoglycan-associated protein